MRLIKIAGENHHIRYDLKIKKLVEQQARKAGNPKQLLELCFGGTQEDADLVIWGGIRGGDKKTQLTPDDVTDLLQQHLEAGGDWRKDVLVPVLQEIEDAKVAGIRPGAIKKMFAEVFAEDEPSKAQAVPAE